MQGFTTSSKCLGEANDMIMIFIVVSPSLVHAFMRALIIVKGLGTRLEVGPGER